MLSSQAPLPVLACTQNALLLPAQRSPGVSRTPLPLCLVLLLVPFPVMPLSSRCPLPTTYILKTRFKWCFPTKLSLATPDCNWLFFSELCSPIFCVLATVLRTCCIALLFSQVKVLLSGAEEYPAPVFLQLLSYLGPSVCSLNISQVLAEVQRGPGHCHLHGPFTITSLYMKIRGK